MTQITRIKNNTTSDGTWVGQLIAAGEYHDISVSDINLWNSNAVVFSSVASGDLVVNNGADSTSDFTDPTEGWNWLLGNTLPLSNLGYKLGVHQSSKPVVAGKEFYAVWSGAGDDIANGIIGGGDLLTFDFDGDAGNPVLELEKDINFDPQFGMVYIHEGYMKWGGNAGSGVSVSALIMTNPTSLQQSVNLDLVVEDNWIKYSTSGAGTGTHGFAANPILIARSHSKDGDWDYDTINGLTPNFNGDGLYKISDIERTAHNYINRLPICHTPGGYSRMASEESAYLPPGYFIRIKVANPNNDLLDCAFIFEAFREQTAL